MSNGLASTYQAPTAEVLGNLQRIVMIEDEQVRMRQFEELARSADEGVLFCLAQHADPASLLDAELCRRARQLLGSEKEKWALLAASAQEGSTIQKVALFLGDA